jgi:hypothetical protein
MTNQKDTIEDLIINDDMLVKVVVLSDEQKRRLMEAPGAEFITSWSDKETPNGKR